MEKRRGQLGKVKRTWIQPIKTRNSVRTQNKLLTLNISSRRLYRLQTKICWHAVLRWEFIKENKKVRKQENTLSDKKAIKKKEKKKENMLSTKEAINKKQVESVFPFFNPHFLVFFYKFSLPSFSR